MTAHLGHIAVTTWPGPRACSTDVFADHELRYRLPSICEAGGKANPTIIERV